jgi:hypothetical protein
LVAGIVAWFTIRRRRARSAPSAPYIDGQGDMGQAMPYPLGIETPRLYVRVFFARLGSMPAYQGVTNRTIEPPRIPQTQVHTRHRPHPRPSTRRTTVAISLALNPTCKVNDRHTEACLRFDRSVFHPFLSLYLSKIKRTFAQVLWLVYGIIKSADYGAYALFCMLFRGDISDLFTVQLTRMGMIHTNFIYTILYV